MIGRRERWCYAAGDLGFNLVWQSIELYLLFFLERGLGLAAPLAAAFFVAGAAADLVADPLVGALADRAERRFPLRLWVAAGGPLAALLLAAVFAVPPGRGWASAWPALAGYLALRVAYSLGNVPYAALPSRLSPDPSDHIALTCARMQGAALGGLIAATTYLLLPAEGGADFHAGALLLAALGLPAFLATLLGVRERTPAFPDVAPHGPGPFSAVRLIGRSAPLRRLLAIVFTAGLAVTVVGNSLLFLFEQVGRVRLGFWVAFASSASLFVTAPLWTACANRTGRLRTLLAAAALGAAASVGALITRGVAATTLFALGAIIAGCGISLMFWAFVPAVIARCEADAAGAPCAASVAALANVARKLAQALAPTLIALTQALPGSIRWAMALSFLAALAVVLAVAPGLAEVRGSVRVRARLRQGIA